MPLFFPPPFLFMPILAMHPATELTNALVVLLSPFWSVSAPIAIPRNPLHYDKSPSIRVQAADKSRPVLFQLGGHDIHIFNASFVAQNNENSISQDFDLDSKPERYDIES